MLAGWVAVGYACTGEGHRCENFKAAWPRLGWSPGEGRLVAWERWRRGSRFACGTDRDVCMLG